MLFHGEINQSYALSFHLVLLDHREPAMLKERLGDEGCFNVYAFDLSGSGFLLQVLIQRGGYPLFLKVWMSVCAVNMAIRV